MPTLSAPTYEAFLPAPLLAALVDASEPARGVAGMYVAAGIQEEFPAVETTEALSLVAAVTRAVRPHLARILHQRALDRAFVDQTTTACQAANHGRSVRDVSYSTVIGVQDAAGRTVVGPQPGPPPDIAPVAVPPFLRGEQVTLFGPPDTERMAINAMNALHRRRDDEPAIVGALVDAGGQLPRWGADDEDSQTPVMSMFLRATQNLMGCYDRTLRYTDTRRGRTYELESDRLSLPIKRIPGLALPDGNHILDGLPVPLHIFDFVSHVWHNRYRPQSLVFYVPKLENEEEAAYLRALIETTDQAVRAADADCRPATIQVLCVFENPRAIFRIREMAAALGPHFLGGSLGWHDYLASAARLFKNDPNYRIPVKADPDIVVKHIKESHLVLSTTMQEIGGLAIGGMYGILPEDGNERSQVVSMVGYIRDVVTQLKRGLNGFWVAHPDFVRPGLALVEAWRRFAADPTDTSLRSLVAALVPQADEQQRLLQFIDGEDVHGLSPDEPGYARSLLAADIEVSERIPNHHPDEVRYNIFQALQYLAAWLSGTGCVALPATLRTASGESVFVRIMDDLATTERSRWELWAEVHHGRVATALFECILSEEVNFLRTDVDTNTRRIQVRWRDEAARWYPVAVRILHQLVTDPHPVEFAPELLLPFTFPVVRDAENPWEQAQRLCPGKYRELPPSLLV